MKKRNSGASEIAARHRRLSETVVIGSESKEGFIAVLESLHGEFQPSPGIETFLVEKMAISRWRSMRIERLGVPASTHTVENPKARALAERFEARCRRQYTRALEALLRLRAESETGKKSGGTADKRA